MNILPSNIPVGVIAVLCCLAAVGCGKQDVAESRLSGNASSKAGRVKTPSYLTPEEVTRQAALAEAGDAEACMKLFYHYEFTQQDFKNADRCLAKAVSLGSTTAQKFVEVRESMEAVKRRNKAAAGGTTEAETPSPKGLRKSVAERTKAPSESVVKVSLPAQKPARL